MMAINPPPPKRHSITVVQLSYTQPTMVQLHLPRPLPGSIENAALRSRFCYNRIGVDENPL